MRRKQATGQAHPGDTYTNRQQCWLAALWVVSLLFVGAAILSSITHIGAGATGESGHVPGTVPYGVLLAQAAFMASPVLLAAGLSVRPALRGAVRPYGVLLPPRPALPRFLAGIGLTWLIMGATGIASLLARTVRGSPNVGVSQTADPSASEMSVLAVVAGLWEEAIYVALPVGFVCLTGTLLNVALKRFWGKAPIITPARLWVLAAVVVVLWSAVHRATGHLYQGHEAAISGLVWGAGLALVFLWVRSIWPLMIGHALYNLPRDHDALLDLTLHQLVVPASVAILGVVLTLIITHKTSQRDIEVVESS